MRGLTIASLLATTITLVAKTFAEPDPNFHIYLSFGQSNMYGSGPIEDQDLIVDERFQLLSSVSCGDRELGQWYTAVPPLADCNAGIGPTDYFGRTLVEELPDVKVGVVVVAIPGCDIQLFEKDNYTSYVPPDWMVDYINADGGNPYQRLVDMAKIAQESGVIKGILLHQGETNNGQEDWPLRVKAIYENLLQDLDLKAEEVPLLAGEVVSLEKEGNCGLHNTVVNKLPEVVPTSHVVYASDLDQQGDGYHFTTPSYRIFGKRYAEIMLDILDEAEGEEPTECETEIETEDSDCYTESETEGVDEPEVPTEEESEVVDEPEVPTEEECTEIVYEEVDCDDEGNEIVDEPEKTEDVDEPEETCWSEPLGYPCCKKENPHVYYRDEDGVWGVENHNWCGITVKGCWSEKLGYPCCEKENPKIYYKDANGIWGVEHGNWCGIIA